MVKEIEWKDLNEPRTFIRFKGVWDMQDLYESMVDWFRLRKFKFNEVLYKHKHPSPFGVERQYTWQAIRNETDYVRSQYIVYFHTYDARDVDIVMPDGTKKVFTKGRIWMEIGVATISDYDTNWDQKAFYKSLKNFYNKYVIRKEFTEGFGPKNRYEMYALAAMVKERLRMEAEEFEQRYYTGVHKVY